MFVFHKALNVLHLLTAFFRRGEESNWRCLAEEEAQAGKERAILAYGIPLAPVTSFKYLGRVLLVADYDWPSVVHNIQRSQQKWVRLSWVLIREDAYARTLGRIYVAVVQAVILYGLETWVVSPCIGSVLGEFHHRMARRLMGRKPQIGWDGGWVYPPLD